MEVLLFQICLFIIILFSGIFGRKARNWTILIAILFTVIMVFMTWLLILQFITIFIAYLISETYIENKSNDRLDNIDKKYGKGCIILIVIGGILLLILNYFASKSL